MMDLLNCRLLSFAVELDSLAINIYASIVIYLGAVNCQYSRPKMQYYPLKFVPHFD